MASNLNEVADGIAAKLYGTPEDSTEVEQPEEQSEDEQTEALEAEGQASAEGETEDAAEDEAAQSEDEETTEESSQTWTLDELAESLGDNPIVLPNGDKVTAKELQAGYLRTEDYTRKTQAVAEERKAAEAERSRGSAEVAQRLETLDGLMNVAEQSLMQEYNAVNWKELDEDDPGRAANLRQQYGQRAQQLEQVKAQAGQARQQAMREQLRAAQGEWQKMLQESQTILQRESAGFRKDASAYVKEMSEYAVSLGFPAADVYPRHEDGELVHPGMIDAKTVLLLEKAKAYDDLMKSKDTKRVRKVVKALKPKGAAQAVGGAGREARKQFRKTGKTADMADALLQSSRLFRG